MSGIPCIVVASGNSTKAFAQSFKDAAPGKIMPMANVAIGLANTLCTLAGTYDPVATEPQQLLATQVMSAFNEAAASMDVTHQFNAREFAHADTMLAIFNKKAQDVVDQILANP